ncbi:MAG TPA: hypothetical protein VJ842_19545 [Pyrinomonadaceae bacterium]|nr:hypothetical protein [Pyrinomonadaceae bacterium]
MKKAYASSLRVATALAVLLLVFISIQDLVAFIAKAQWCPVPPRYSAASGNQNWKWAKEATVAVIISTDFTAAEQQAIQDAFIAWNNRRWVNCSLVTFNGFQQGPVAESCKPSRFSGVILLTAIFLTVLHNERIEQVV